jgi:hypothetical protein
MMTVGKIALVVAIGLFSYLVAAYGVIVFVIGSVAAACFVMAVLISRTV